MNIWKVLLALLRDQVGWSTEMAVTGISEIDAAIPEFWAEGAIHDGNRESFWGQLAGKEGARMPIIDKTGPLNDKGDKLTFTTIAQLMGAGVTGESVLKGNEEQLTIGTFYVSPDVVRHAVAVTWKATKQANFPLVKAAGQLLKDWFGRKFDADIFQTIISSASVETLYAGSGNDSTDDLNSADGDTFGPAEIQKIQLALLRQGALPLQVTRVNARTVPIYGCVYSEIDGYRLMNNTTFVNDIKESLQRFKQGGEHPLFRGAIGMYGNMILYPYYSQLQIPQGTSLRPETVVYATCITSATTLSVGGADADDGVTPSYTLFFASAGSLQVGDEIMVYTGTTVNSFTGLTRGASSTTDAQHAPNALVTQRNVSTVIGFGAEAICRALPLNATPIGQKDDYGDQTGIGIKAYYGHAINLSARRSTKATALVKMKCYSENPGSV